MDTQIWYTIFSTLLGGIYGAFQRLGEVFFLLTFFYIWGKKDLFSDFFMVQMIFWQKLSSEYRE